MTQIYKYGSKKLSRRDFIKVAGVSAAAGLAGCTPIGKVLSGFIETPTAPNTKTPTPQPTVTQEPTEIPKPEIPADIITQSLDLIATDPVKEEGTGDWVITDLRERNTQIFWRWDPDNKRWLDERPLYWQCGRSYSVDGSGYDSSVTAEARKLPTGLWREVPLSHPDYLTVATARTCVTKVYYPPIEPSLGLTKLGKIGFFDLDGKIHEYEFGGANALNGGAAELMSLGILGTTRRFCLYSLADASVALSEFYHYPSQFATRTVLVDMITRDTKVIWEKETFLEYRDLTLQLIEALKTGQGFPENVPQGFFLWTTAFYFTGGFKPSNFKE